MVGAYLIALARLLLALSAPFVALPALGVALVWVALLCVAGHQMYQAGRCPSCGEQHYAVLVVGMAIHLLPLNYRQRMVDMLISFLSVFALFMVLPWWVAILCAVPLVWGAPALFLLGVQQSSVVVQMMQMGADRDDDAA